MAEDRAIAGEPFGARIADGSGTATAEPDLLRGRYEPLELVGRGGQGDVVRAWDHQHHRPVALKIRAVPPGADRERILTEARSLLELRPHDNLGIIRDDFFEGDHHYLVLDWISGDDLRSRLRREGAPGLPFDVVVAAISDVADALDHLHGHEPPILHGDVKPANVVIADGARPRAVLVDFGLASTGATEVNGGTLAYAAPEILVGERASPRSDVYSLAATTFELLTGRVPGPSATLDWSGVPKEAIPAVRSTLVNGLALDPDQRPRSAGAFVEMLTSGRPSDRAALRRPSHSPGHRIRMVGAALGAAIGGGLLVALVDDDPKPEAVVTAVDSDRPEAADDPAPSLPGGEEPVGRLGVYSTRGVIETYVVGGSGTLLSVDRQEGLTANWDVIVPIAEHHLLFYRARDAYAVAVDWRDDGAILDLYSPPGMATGWTHITVVRPGQLHFYNAATGAQTLITYDADVNLLATEALAPTRPGWTHLLRLTDGTLLRYDAASGAASLVAFDAEGRPAPEVGLTGWQPSLEALAVIGDGRLLAGRGGVVQLLSVDGASVEVLDERTIDEPWVHAASLGGGQAMLYDPATGTATVVSVQEDRLELGEPVSTLVAGAILIGRV